MEISGESRPEKTEIDRARGYLRKNFLCVRIFLAHPVVNAKGIPKNVAYQGNRFCHLVVVNTNFFYSSKKYRLVQVCNNYTGRLDFNRCDKIL